MMKRIPIFLSLFLFAAACTVMQEEDSIRVPDSPLEQAPSNSAPGHIRIKFKEAPTPTKAAGIDLSALGNYTMVRTFRPAGKWEKRHHEAGLDRWYDVIFDESVSLTKATYAASLLEEVDIVECVPQVKAMGITYPFNDPRLPEQWHYINPGGQSQWAEGCDINAINAWTIETGKPEVIVAVNDGGVDYAHEDLQANMWVNQAELNGQQGVDDDNNGFDDDIYGFSFITYDGKTPIGKITPHDHGTHVAGTIGAVNNNGIGVSGVAGGNGDANSGIRIMTTPTLDGQHGAFTPDSFVYAADNGAVLINCSWGYVKNENPTPSAVSEAIDYFNEKAGFDENGNQTGPMAGGLVIFAAGNDGREVEHPAMDDNVFAVAALSANYVRSYFTSYGDWIDISAPGGDANRKTYVLSTLPNNGYGNMQGSSMAAPHVTGVAALIVSYYGAGRKGFTRDQLIYLLQSTANKKALEENGSFANKLGAGLVDAYAALMAGDDKEPLPVSAGIMASPVANNVNLEWRIPGDSDHPAPVRFNIYYSKASMASLNPASLPDNVTKVSVSSFGRQAGATMGAEIRDLEFNTKYYLRIQSESMKGLTSALSEEISFNTVSNSAPVITPLNGTTLTVKSHQKGMEMAFQVSDADGHSLKYTVTELKGMTSIWEGTASNARITFFFDAMRLEDGKTYPLVLEVTDGYQAVQQAFNYVIEKNSTPVSSGSIDDIIFEGISAPEVSFRLSDLFSDPDGENLTYPVSSSTTSIIAKATVEGDVLTVKANSPGSTTLTVSATDARGATASIEFRVLVRTSSEAVEAYPNPVQDFLTIRTGKTGDVAVTIYSSLGGKVYEKTLSAVSPFEPAMIDLSSLAAGIYKGVFVTSEETIEKTIVKL